ncbi:MAG: DUF1156 domain-containing protein [Thermodesulfobacteriota bacterium]|nr:DUF1156 domain-containing protein [Thermodesulfobacteriota bacterium]
MTYPKRLIEVDLPIKRISAHSRREKSIRHGHISTLHIWWARRPLAACRAVICAALWPDPVDPLCPLAFRDKARKLMVEWTTHERQALLSAESRPRFEAARQNPKRFDNAEELRRALLDFIADFSNWDNSTVKEFLDTSRALTQAAHEALGGASGTKPLVVDPFAGGGAIPVEALRIGSDVFASDLNPLAVLLNKVVLEYIPKYGKSLADQVRKWGAWVREQAERELSSFYPKEANGATPIGFLWARTIKCEGPGCGVTVPIIKSAAISLRRGSEASMKISYPNGRLKTEVVYGNEAKGISEGTSKRSSVTCPLCGFTTPRKRVSIQSNDLGFGFHMLAVCMKNQDGSREYRQPNDRDLKNLGLADDALAKWKSKTFSGIPAIPHEELPYLRSIFNVRVYGVDEWCKLFHRRQLLSSLIFTETVRRAATVVKGEIRDDAFASAIIECLALSVSNAFQYQCNIATYLTEGIKSAFIQGQSLPMKMDFIEANPLIDELAGGYPYSLSQHVSGLDYCSSYTYQSGTAQQISALNSTLPEDSVDLLATDPPYYDVVPYADCSDFFYVWLRRMLRGIATFPTDSELTPKDEEIVQLAERNPRYKIRTKNWFENKIRESFLSARCAVKPAGALMVIFAHKETSAWEALLKAVLDAGWIVTGSWPIDTEKGSRLRANDSAVLASSIHLFCRPRENPDGSVRADNIGDWRDVLAELPHRIHEWMPRLGEEGVVGADAIFACLGPALEIFSRYSRVEKGSGEAVTLKEYLEQVWAAVAKEALTMIFTGADATGFEEDARLTAMWLWTLSTGNNGNGKRKSSKEDDEIDDEDESEKAKKAIGGYALEYDAARKIAQGLGAHLEKLSTVVEVKGDTARLLPVSERTRYLFGKDEAQAPGGKRKKKEPQLKLGFMKEIEDIETKDGWGTKSAPRAGSTVLDRLHQSMILFAAGRSEALKRFLVEEGAGNDQRFWRLAQALSALYPKSSDEKRWVDGVLARKKGLGF